MRRGVMRGRNLSPVEASAADVPNRSRLPRWAGLVPGLFLLFGLGACGHSREHYAHQPDHSPGVMAYIDRLDQPERDHDQKPAQVIEVLALGPGMRVADLGAGSGYFTWRFLDAVTNSGKVYAIDIEPEALRHIQRRLARHPASYSAEFVLATSDNPNLPAESVDLIFVCNTYHHLQNRSAYFKKLGKALRNGGRIAIVDFYHDDRSGDLGFSKRHLIARDTVQQELSAAGYRLTKEHTFLPHQYFLEFVPH